VKKQYVPAALRRKVRQRARNKCEYCLLDQEYAFFVHEPDHIIAEKHGGETNLENLALACFDCNRFKGSDIASLDLTSKKLTPLFHPRVQKWSDHFRVNQGIILPLTAIGRVTERLLKFNLTERVEVREILSRDGYYP
jgi:5-methylcytosine-specific restriction endonuclease McrA